MTIRLNGTNGRDTLIAVLPDAYIMEGLDGDDKLIGGAFGDSLYGGIGMDILDGGAGNDSLYGGAGADQLIGGAGNDTANYAASASGVSVSLVTGRGSGGDAHGDSLTGIEGLIGSAYADHLVGDGADNRLRGGAGADFLDGGAGVDTADYSDSQIAVTVNLQNGLGLGGDAQNDRLLNIENVSGSREDDTLIGNAGANYLSGDFGDDMLFGGGGADTLIGGFGNDLLEGGAGADVINGLIGNDTATYATSNAGVKVNLETGTATGGHAQGDTVGAIENLIGSGFNDLLVGTSGDNVINGGNGDDVIRGGAGTDQVWGGAGDDHFVFNQADQPVAVAGPNFEVIRDFTAGGVEDVIDLSDAGTGFMSLNDVLANALSGNGGTLIDLGPSGAVFLEGVQMASLTANDFIFV
jgi:Ca2+-binding RTX toxin-like protein